MGVFYACCLAILEMTFVFVVLLLLHGLRKAIGAAGFYLSLGLLFAFMQLVGAADMNILTGFPGLNFNLSSTVLLLPFLSALIVIYIADGTLEAQRLIIALMAGLGIFTYLASMTTTQAAWNAGAQDVSPFTGELATLLRGSVRSMSANVVSFAVDLFLIPIIYQWIRNCKCRMFFCVTGALFVGQAADSLLFNSIFFWGQNEWWSELAFTYLARAISILLLSGIASLYLSRIKIEEPGAGRRSLDIIIAFFGASGKAKALEHDLKETEERYRLLFGSAADMIAVADRRGILYDANPAALRLMNLSGKELGRISIQEAAGVPQEVWSSIPERIPGGKSTELSSALIPRTKREVELSFSPVAIGDNPMLIVFGRDVTERRKLDREREEWQEQTFHRQRLESIGRLAGGIAHDFNNFLHAMQGHLDIIRYMHPVSDPDVNRHLDGIDSISEKAATLTKQLLGFARKGNYNETQIELDSFLRATTALFLPASSSLPINLNLKISKNGPFSISGDPIQLQQALLNILFNARDAMRDVPEAERKLHIFLAPLAEIKDCTPDPPPDAVPAKDAKYCVIRIQDSGPGIEPSIMNRIFEPFFTTKPIGQGTGMGLSMAYGILLSHKGWIQAENSRSGGALFSLFLPLRVSNGESTQIFDATELSGK